MSIFNTGPSLETQTNKKRHERRGKSKGGRNRAISKSTTGITCRRRILRNLTQKQTSAKNGKLIRNQETPCGRAKGAKPGMRLLNKIAGNAERDLIGLTRPRHFAPRQKNENAADTRIPTTNLNDHQIDTKYQERINNEKN